TASLHKMSALRRDLEAWHGRHLSREEEKSFDLRSLLGKPAMVTVTETENGKRKISGISGLAKGMPVPKPVNPPLYFSFDPAEFSEEALEQVPQFWRDVIRQSPEYKLLQGATR
ncbi:MAG TPA: hypothetical protein VHS06_08290, partial [Chloroflexota bacterium]|nr:hypothetical protein [Chloroflexota bacterium]